MILEQEERELQNRQKNLDMEVRASRGVQGRRKRNVRRLDLMKAERAKLRGDKHALTRMMARIAFTPLEQELGLALSAISTMSACHLKRRSAEGPGKVIFNKFNLRIQRGDRIGIVGKNGSKTTFLKLFDRWR